LDQPSKILVSIVSGDIDEREMKKKMDAVAFVQGAAVVASRLINEAAGDQTFLESSTASNLAKQIALECIRNNGKRKLSRSFSNWFTKEMQRNARRDSRIAPL
jgi:hypothetical protein